MPLRNEVEEVVIDQSDKGSGTFLDSDNVDIFGDNDALADIVPHESHKIKQPDNFLGEVAEDDTTTEEDDQDGETVDESELDEEQEGDDTGESGSDEGVDEEFESEDETEFENEFEISDSEYKFLQKQEKDQLIARILKHRKGQGTLQSKIAKLEGTLSKDIVDSVISGQTDGRVVRQLMSDLSQHESFQHYVADFYNKYEFKDGTYTKIDDAPDKGTLEKFSELTIKKLSLDINDFMPEGETFNPGEVYISGTASNKAKSKYETEAGKIDRELNNIIGNSVDASSKRSASIQSAKQKSEQQLKDAIDSDKSLKNNFNAQNEFRQFMQQNSSNLAKVFLAAYRYEKASNSKVKKLVLNEKKNLSKNKRKVRTGGRKVSTDKVVESKSYIEDELFGDL